MRSFWQQALSSQGYVEESRQLTLKGRAAAFLQVATPALLSYRSDDGDGLGHESTLRARSQIQDIDWRDCYSILLKQKSMSKPCISCQDLRDAKAALQGFNELLRGFFDLFRQWFGGTWGGPGKTGWRSGGCRIGCFDTCYREPWRLVDRLGPGRNRWRLWGLLEMVRRWAPEDGAYSTNLQLVANEPFCGWRLPRGGKDWDIAKASRLWHHEKNQWPVRQVGDVTAVRISTSTKLLRHHTYNDIPLPF